MKRPYNPMDAATLDATKVSMLRRLEACRRLKRQFDAHLLEPSIFDKDLIGQSFVFFAGAVYLHALEIENARLYTQTTTPQSFKELTPEKWVKEWDIKHPEFNDALSNLYNYRNVTNHGPSRDRSRVQVSFSPLRGVISFLFSDQKDKQIISTVAMINGIPQEDGQVWQTRMLEVLEKLASEYQ